MESDGLQLLDFPSWRSYHLQGVRTTGLSRLVFYVSICSQIGAAAFAQCSALTGEGVTEVNLCN